MRDAHTAIGRTVDIVLDSAAAHPKPTRMRVVGTVIVPPNPSRRRSSAREPLWRWRALRGRTRASQRSWARCRSWCASAPGVSRDAGLTAISNDITGPPNPLVAAAERPANVVSLATIANVPVLLSGPLALTAAGTLAHTLASPTRKGPRDLAILKSLGFIRRQVRHVVGWQATTIAAIALLIGLPAGIAGGRWARRVSPPSSSCCPSQPSRSLRSSSP
jgi:hypothetical protein